LNALAQEIDKYSIFKRRYYHLFQRTKGLKRGNIRAFLGIKTWVKELEYYNNEIQGHKAHVYALEDSIAFFEKHDRYEIEKEFLTCKETWLNNKDPIVYSNVIKPILTSPISSIKKWTPNHRTMISLFSGAMGLDLGFMAAGFELRLANDISQESFNTVTKNLPKVNFIHADINGVTSNEIMSKAGLDVGEVDVLVGGPPCQPFSTAGKREGLKDPRASPLREYVRVIKELQPKVFVMEEVEGLLSSRLTHVPISERDGKILKNEEKTGSMFKVVQAMLESTRYKFGYWVLNSADYGAPQCRRRLIIIGTNKGIPKPPVKTHSEAQLSLLDGSRLEPWNTLWEATADLQSKEQEFIKFSKPRKNYMRMIVPGGNWRHLPDNLVREALGGAYESGGGKMGYFRRLSWDEPSPTIVTSPAQNSTMLCHPYNNRPLSVEEYKRIQGFPDDWVIMGSTIYEKYKLIGDAVPVHLSYAIARKVSQLLEVS